MEAPSPSDLPTAELTQQYVERLCPVTGTIYQESDHSDGESDWCDDWLYNKTPPVNLQHVGESVDPSYQDGGLAGEQEDSLPDEQENGHPDEQEVLPDSVWFG